MKLVIDIPDREYKQRMEFPLCYDSTIDKAIANGTPLSKELEKIKVGLDNLAPLELIHKSRVLNFLDNRISELKGE